MIKEALMHILGLDEKTSRIVEMLLTKLNQTETVEQHLLSLSDEVVAAMKQMDGIIDDPNDPDNVSYTRRFNKHETDGWDPEKDRDRSRLASSTSPPVIEPTEYTIRESKKPSFLGYLAEQSMAQTDNELIKMGTEIDDNIDDVTKKRIGAYMKQGNKEAADRLRTRALRRNKMTNAQPMTPTQALVNAKKKQLAQALQADARNRPQQPQGNENPNNPNDLNNNGMEQR